VIIPRRFYKRRKDVVFAIQYIWPWFIHGAYPAIPTAPLVLKFGIHQLRTGREKGSERGDRKRDRIMQWVESQCS
jgi:hypothetical protein